MAVLFLAAAYCLSREGAKLVENMEGQKKLVVVDPGHGGEDPGKIGINDEKEKDINLEISDAEGKTGEAGDFRGDDEGRGRRSV